MRYPTIEQAHWLLTEAERFNPGPWGNHSRFVAHCARQIAARCTGLEEEKAYVLGLLHDIGRKFGKGHLAHVYDGWRYMLELGYGDAARICLTHSFSIRDLDAYIGKRDISEHQQKELSDALAECVYDDYDLLIQLCDCLAGSDGIMDMEQRMLDVKTRYGSYPQEKWDRNMALKQHFESKLQCSIYEAVGFFP